MNKVRINGIEIYAFKSPSEVIEYVSERKGILVAVNARKINQATDETRKIINSNIGYADGLGAVTVLHKKGHPECPKIAGCDLWLKIVDRFADSKKFYLVGATEDIISETVSKLQNQYPKINIVGYRNGYLKSDDERITLIDDIVEKKPDIVFVAMGSPIQELLMEDMASRHKAIYQGLGGSFKVYCGVDKRAPQWFIDHNMEAVYRFLFLSTRPGKVKRFLSCINFFTKLNLGLIK